MFVNLEFPTSSCWVSCREDKNLYYSGRKNKQGRRHEWDRKWVTGSVSLAAGEISGKNLKKPTMSTRCSHHLQDKIDILSNINHSEPNKLARQSQAEKKTFFMSIKHVISLDTSPSSVPESCFVFHSRIIKNTCSKLTALLHGLTPRTHTLLCSHQIWG